MASTRRSASGAASAARASSRTTRRRSPRGWSCSTPSTRSRPSRPTTWRCAGTARPASAGRARRRSTACRKLMCMTRLSELPTWTSRSPCEPMQAFPLDPRPGHRRVLELPRQEGDQAVQAADAGRPRRHLAHAAGGHRARAGVPQVHRVLPVPGRLPRAARPPQARGVHRAALPGAHRGAGDAPARHRGPHRRAEGRRTASATATSPSAARRSAPRTSRSPTTRSSRSRSGWSIGYYDPIGRLFNIGRK